MLWLRLPPAVWLVHVMFSIFLFRAENTILSNSGFNPFFHSISNYMKNRSLGICISPTNYPTCLDKLRKSPIDRGPDWGNFLPEINRSQRTLRDTCSGELKPGIDVFVGAGGTKAVETELLVRVFFPSLDAR